MTDPQPSRVERDGIRTERRGEVTVITNLETGASVTVTDAQFRALVDHAAWHLRAPWLLSRAIPAAPPQLNRKETRS
jgi:hypothetical protein